MKGFQKKIPDFFQKKQSLTIGKKNVLGGMKFSRES